MSWADRRRAKLAATGLGFAALGASLFLLVRRLPATIIDPAALSDASDDIAQQLGPFAFVLAFRGAKEAVGAHPIAAVALAGATTCGMLLFGLFGTRFHDRFLATFNDDVLVPIVAVDVTADRDGAAPAFVRLPWQLGESGPRRQIWDALFHWTQAISLRRRWRPTGTGYGKMYSVGFLVGRGGSGKSRLAAEFGRTLGRRDVLGDSHYWDRRRPGRAALAFGAYARRTLPFSRPRSGDPWDAGLVRNRSADDQQRRYIEALRDWRPRRPTLLILDDPGEEETADVHAALSAVAEKARHPICLLVVDQIVPKGPLSYDASERCWKFDRFAAADPPPFTLSTTSWFDQKATLQIAFAQGALRQVPSRVQKEVRERLYPLTEGNPLLIELALEWVVERGSLAGVTVPELRRARMRRVIDALGRRGVRAPSQWTQLVLASMVGGAPQAAVLAAMEAEHVIGTATDLPSAGDLQACFPADDLQGGSRRIPSLRPDLLTAVLVDELYARGDWLGEPEALVRAAFRLDPAMMLRRQRYLAASERLGPALDAIDPANIPGITPLQWAIARADIAVHAGPYDPERWTSGRQAARMATAERTIARLGRTAREALLPALADFVTRSVDPQAARQLIPEALLRLVHLTAAPMSVAIAHSYWADLYGSLRGTDIIDSDLGPLAGPMRAAEHVADDRIAADKLFEAIWLLCSELRVTMAPIISTLAPTSDEPVEQARRARVKAAVSAAQGDVGAARFAADEAEALAIAFDADLAVQREAAEARRYEVYGCAAIPDGAEAMAARAAANQVAAIAATYQMDADIQLQAALAHAAHALAEAKVPDGAQAAATRAVGDQVARFAVTTAANLDLQHAAAMARCFEAYSWSSAPAGAHAADARAAANQAAAIANAFADSSAVQLDAAEARTNEAFGWSQVPAGAHAAAAHAAADQVAAIAAAFPNHAKIHLAATKARSNEAYGWSQVPAGTQASEGRAAASRAAAIAAAFPGDASIQYQAAKARRLEAYAWSLVPAGTEANKAHAAAEQVVAIAALFFEDFDMQREAASARRFEAHGWCMVPDGAQASAARAAADQVTEIAASFPDDVVIQQEVAAARRYETYGWSMVPAGAQAFAAHEAANQVAAVAAKFLHDAPMQEELAEARRYEAYGWCMVPAGRGLDQARFALRSITLIADRWPRAAGIVKQRQLAYDYIAQEERKLSKRSSTP